VWIADARLATFVPLDRVIFTDLFLDGDVLNVFVPHRWQRVRHRQLWEAALKGLPAGS
jgi:hypothetical protein